MDFNPKLIKIKRLNETPRVLRIITQRPFYTGSGLTLVELIKQTKNAGFDQFIIFGQPIGEQNPLKEIIDEKFTKPVYFNNPETSEKGEINFPVAGMSDKMPYPSTKFSEFNGNMLENYLKVFTQKINEAVKTFNPTIIHSNHLWLVTALCRVLHPDIPILGTCHNTALRQLVLAKKLKDFTRPIRYLDAISVLNDKQGELVKKAFHFTDIEVKNKFHVVSIGFNTEVFYCPKHHEDARVKKLIYVGKLSKAKGVPELIQASKELIKEGNLNFELFLAGSGAGKEKNQILDSVKGYENQIKFLGQISQRQLANYFRESNLFILPSYYEGMPMVLIEALACGCNAIMTDLPGIKETINKVCGDLDQISFIPHPKMKTIDQPLQEEIPKFIKKIKEAIKFQLDKEKISINNPKISENVKSSFSWEASVNKFLRIYYELLKKE